MAHPMVQRAHHVVRNYFLHILCGSLVLTAGMLILNSGLKAAGPILFLDSFGVADGLITNEFAHWNPGHGKASANWDMTSGSLYAKGGTAWSGSPDNLDPDATSSNGNNSAVFRLNTKRFDFGDVQVSFRLLMNSLSTTSTTPAVDWDGIHIFLRYQSEYNLYYASVNRRDGHVVIKKKCSGGSTNGGTYYELAPGEVTGHPLPFGTWQNVAASVQNNSDGTVTIKLYREGALLATATDNGVGCVPIRAAGATGIRGDNANFQFDDFTVESLSALGGATPTPTTSAKTGKTPKPASGTGAAIASTPEVQSAAESPTPSPTASAQPTTKPKDTHQSNPSPLDAAVLTKAAATQPTFWAGIVAAALAVILAALLVQDHRRPKPAARRPSGSRRR
jgi:hypothetical protein